MWALPVGLAILSSPSVRNEFQAYSKLLFLINLVLFDNTEQQLHEESFPGRKKISYGEKSCFNYIGKKMQGFCVQLQN